uniref:Uncharacterized protein n=1 Tax=Peronospora matthiolae TaxID=2874970 RepID=A0AAV1UDY4_9STRA
MRFERRHIALPPGPSLLRVAVFTKHNTLLSIETSDATAPSLRRSSERLSTSCRRKNHMFSGLPYYTMFYAVRGAKHTFVSVKTAS